MNPRSSDWLQQRVELLLAELSELGMTTTPSAAGDLIRERVDWVAANMRIGKAAARHYLTDETVKSLAETIAFSMTEEAPGAEVPVAVVGRAVSALAEASLVRLHDGDDVEHLQATIDQLSHAISAVGLVLAAQDFPASAGFPPALLHRIARYLDAAADVALESAQPPASDEGKTTELTADLAATLHLDARMLRDFAMA